MGTTSAHDAIHDNVSRLPAGQAAGYTTGSSDIRWTAADWAAHPGAVRIDQDFAASDPSADILDVERGAATFADCPVWSKRAIQDFAIAARPGQRMPGIYFSMSNVHYVANALVNGGVNGGIGFFVAIWGISPQAAIDMIESASGPFPIIGVQYNDGMFYDYDVFSTAWLENISGNFARNPVSGLDVTRRGFTSVDLAWNRAANATSYSIKTYWRGELVESQITNITSIRVRNLLPTHTYTFKVRAHPGGSVGADATVKATTRPA